MAVKHTRAEESLALMKEVYTLLDEPGCGISFSPAKSGNFMMYCSGDFIGGLFGGELCLVYTEAAAEAARPPRARLPRLFERSAPQNAARPA